MIRYDTLAVGCTQCNTLTNLSMDFIIQITQASSFCSIRAMTNPILNSVVSDLTNFFCIMPPPTVTGDVRCLGVLFRKRIISNGQAPSVQSINPTRTSDRSYVTLHSSAPTIFSYFAPIRPYWLLGNLEKYYVRANYFSPRGALETNYLRPRDQLYRSDLGTF